MWRRGRTEKESVPGTTHLCGRYVLPGHLVANSRRLLPQSRRQRRPAPPATATLLLLRRVSPARGSRLRSRRRRGQRRHSSIRPGRPRRRQFLRRGNPNPAPYGRNSCEFEMEQQAIDDASARDASSGKSPARFTTARSGIVVGDDRGVGGVSGTRDGTADARSEETVAEDVAAEYREHVRTRC
jgi:hypothetical protein